MLLLITAVVTHLPWFQLGNTLTHTDWIVWPDETARSLVFTWTAWVPFMNFGESNIQMSFALIATLWSAIIGAGLNFDTAVKLTFFIPIAVFGFVSPYLFFRKLAPGDGVAFLVAIFYGATTPFLVRQTAHLPIAFVYSVAPLLLLLLENALRRRSFGAWLAFAAAYIVGVCYELRIMFIMTFVLAAYAAYFHGKSLYKQRRSLAVGIALIIALSLFFLLPVAFGGFSAEISHFAKRGLFGEQFLNLAHAFALSEPFWTGGLPDRDFVVQPIHWYLWLIPLVCFSALLLPKRTANKHGLFFAAVALVGILLTKQSSVPFPSFFAWLYENFPGFSLFRDGSKFFILIALGYAGLLHSLFTSLAQGRATVRKRVVFGATAMVVLAVAGMNVLPLVTGEIGTLFVPRRMPTDYRVMREAIGGQEEYFRTAWVPRSSPWAFFSANHPKFDVAEAPWTGWRLFSGSDPTLSPERIMAPLERSYSDALLDASAVKYVVVPLRDAANDNDFFRDYGGHSDTAIRDWYVSRLQALPYLRSADLGTKEVAVFENDKARSYVAALDSVLAFASSENLEQKYAFTTKALGAGFDFLIADDAKDVPAPVVDMLFENVSDRDLSLRGYEAGGETGELSTTLYEKHGERFFSYQLGGGALRVYAGRPGQLRQAAVPLASAAPRVVFETAAGDGDYVASLGTRIIPLVPAATPLELGSAALPLKIERVSPVNVIPNPGFESGLWSKSVGDCNAYDDQPVLRMALSDRVSAGERALELSATRHIACTGTTMPVAAGRRYRLEFDYQSDNAPQAGYYLEFPGSSAAPLQGRLPVNGTEWRRFSRAVDVPADASTALITVYSYADDGGKKEVVTRYDSFSLRELTPVASVPATTTDDSFVPLPFSAFATAGSGVVFTFGDPAEPSGNLIPNPSFEDGLWAETVGDCNRYDSHGDVDMLRAEGGSHGRYVLELGATKHIACTGPTLLPVRENSRYLFSFAYQSPNGLAAGYNLGFNDPDATVIQERLPIGDSNWHLLNRQILVPAGATSVSLTVYSYDEGGGRRIVTRYDNFSLSLLPDLFDRYYLVSRSAEPARLPSEVNFETLDPARTLVRVRGAGAPFYLSLAEAYHDGWQLRFATADGPFSWLPWAKRERIGDERHFALDGFLNGWYVDPAAVCADERCAANPDGTYDLTFVAEFAPQRWFILGLAISTTVFIGSSVWVAGAFVRRRLKKKKRSSSSGHA
ncbi:MAG: hypothetical protein KBC95_01205 [Candidatus Peribacteraceae bacterium]|nr:hypothetical protein [Candidatus Peribacteraceae bacterium]